MELVRGPRRYVDQQPRTDRATVVDRHDDRTPVVEIGHFDPRLERQGTVRRGRARHVETLAGRGLPPDMPVAIPGGPADLAPADHLKGGPLCRRGNVAVGRADTGGAPGGRAVAGIGRGCRRAGEDEGGERYAEGSWHSHPHELRAVAKNLGSAADPRCAPSSVDGRAVAVIVVPGRLGDCPGGTGEKRSEEHTSELQSRRDLVCRLLL